MTAPAMNVMTWAPTARIAVDVVQTTVSALGTRRTSVPFTPAVSTHVALANDAALVDADLTVVACAGTIVSNVQLLEESTALKYLGGSAIVMVPPMGTACAVVKATLKAASFGNPALKGPIIAATKLVAPPSGTVFVVAEVLSLSVVDDTVNGAAA